MHWGEVFTVWAKNVFTMELLVWPTTSDDDDCCNEMDATDICFH